MKADVRESGLVLRMQSWKDFSERPIPNAHVPVNGESIKTADIHKSGSSTSLNDVFGSSDSLDLKIRCGSDEYNVQRALICERSAFFAAACDGIFEKSTITLQEDDPPTVRRMLTYLQTLAYDDEGDAASTQHYMVNGMEAVTSQALTTSTTSLSAQKQWRHAKLINNVVVYAIAQKYGINELKELASIKFRLLLRLKTSSFDIPSIIDAVSGTTSVTDPGLRNGIIEYCTQHSKWILADISVCDSIRHHGELGLGMLHKMLEEKKKMSRQIKELQSYERVFSQVEYMKARLLELRNICKKSGDVSFAQESLKRLRKAIKQLHELANVEK